MPSMMVICESAVNYYIELGATHLCETY